MSNYEKLKLSSFRAGRRVVVGLKNGTFKEGEFALDIINEDWEEDGEKAALGIKTDKNIEAIDLEDILFIADIKGIGYAGVAASA